MDSYNNNVNYNTIMKLMQRFASKCDLVFIIGDNGTGKTMLSKQIKGFIIHDDYSYKKEYSKDDILSLVSNARHTKQKIMIILNSATLPKFGLLEAGITVGYFFTSMTHAIIDSYDGIIKVSTTGKFYAKCRKYYLNIKVRPNQFNGITRPYLFTSKNDTYFGRFKNE